MLSISEYENIDNRLNVRYFNIFIISDGWFLEEVEALVHKIQQEDAALGAIENTDDCSNWSNEEIIFDADDNTTIDHSLQTVADHTPQSVADHASHHVAHHAPQTVADHALQTVADDVPQPVAEDDCSHAAHHLPFVVEPGRIRVKHPWYEIAWLKDILSKSGKKPILPHVRQLFLENQAVKQYCTLKWPDCKDARLKIRRLKDMVKTSY